MRGKKLRGNGLWGSSRIILPQFREAQVNHRRGLRAREKSELDEQRIEELSAAFAEALESEAETAVMVFGEYGDKTTVGVVVAVDPIDKVVKNKTRADTVWITLGDIDNVGRL